jgi:2-C-methyl-D-erythritol 4-phosphate cytidylyltransferase
LTSEQANKQIAVVLAAGGVGSRFATGGTIKHKQCLFLHDRPLYMWSLLSFLGNERIDRIVLVSHQDVIEEIRNDIKKYVSLNPGAAVKRFSASIDLVPGGQSRQESVFLGLKHLKEQSPAPDYVLIHDAARPFIRQTVIDATIDAVIKYGACTVALPVSDTIKRIDGKNIVETIDRSKLVAVHTPQAGRFDWLLSAHQEAEDKGTAATDDAYILEQAGHEVKIVESDRYNIKVTVPEDMLICEAISHMFVSQIMDA